MFFNFPFTTYFGVSFKLLLSLPFYSLQSFPLLTHMSWFLCLRYWLARLYLGALQRGMLVLRQSIEMRRKWFELRCSIKRLKLRGHLWILHWVWRRLWRITHIAESLWCLRHREPWLLWFWKRIVQRSYWGKGVVTLGIRRVNLHGLIVESICESTITSIKSKWVLGLASLFLVEVIDWLIHRWVHLTKTGLKSTLEGRLLLLPRKSWL